MYRIRPARKKDLKALFHLAEQTQGGLVSLYPNTSILKKIIEHSVQSFSKEITQPSNEQYLLILENYNNNNIIGTTAIHVAINTKHPYTTYKITKKLKLNPQIDIKVEYEQLLLVNEHRDQTEICTLYLDPAFRGKKLGALLSRSRFLFMAQFPHRFSRHIIASMRGLYERQTGSPFWNSLGRKIISITLEEASYLEVVVNRQFITDLLPHQAIPIPLLSKAAQKSIAQVRPTTKPAMHMLEKEGFNYLGSVHPLDGGPIIEVNFKDIHTIQSCHIAQIEGLIAHIDKQTPHFLVSNCQLDFYAAYGQVIQIKKNFCRISRELAPQLQVKVGDMIRFMPL